MIHLFKITVTDPEDHLTIYDTFIWDSETQKLIEPEFLCTLSIVYSMYNLQEHTENFTAYAEKCKIEMKHCHSTINDFPMILLYERTESIRQERYNLINGITNEIIFKNVCKDFITQLENAFVINDYDYYLKEKK